MSKSIKVLLLTLLALCLAFSAAFAEETEGTTVTLKITKGEALGGAHSVTEESITIDSAAFKVGTGNVLQYGASNSEMTMYPVLEGEETQVELGTATVTQTTEVYKITLEANGILAATATGTTDNTDTLTFTVEDNVLKYGTQAVTPTSDVPFNVSMTGTDAIYSGSAKIAKSTAGTLSMTELNKTGEPATWTVESGLELTGTLTVLEEDEWDADNKTHSFKVSKAVILVASDDQEGTAKKKIGFEIAANEEYILVSDDTDALKFTFVDGSLTSTDEGEVRYDIDLNGLEVSEVVVEDEGAAFDSADITVFANGKDMGTVTFTSKDAAKSVTVSTDVTVSFDLSKVSFDLVSVDGKGKTSTDLKVAEYVFSVDIESSSKDVYIYFTSGDASFEAKLTINVDSSSSATTETYLLKVSDITITPAGAVTNTAKLISADTDNYSATLNLTDLDSTASGDWGSFAEFTASSDYLGGSFSVTVSTDAKLVNVYVMNGTDWDAVDTDELSGKVITPNTIGWYKVVLSADLIASSDKTVSGDAYFAFDFKVTSVDAPKATGDVVVDASNASTDATGGAGGNPVISAGQKIDTKFLSGTAISPSAFASFFSSATTVTMLSETELVAALQTLGLSESDMGDSENGYKALAFTLPSGFTLTANEKFFVLLTTNENGTGTNRLGVGVVSPKLNGSRTMVIVFKLLKNPAHTADFMTFDAGEYFVGATNDTASADTSSSTRAVFVTAGGTFNIKSDEATLLQGQTASGTATPYEGDDDDDDNQETSSHGSSSGCDAGFGALALLAVAGALAARKVRK